MRVRECLNRLSAGSHWDVKTRGLMAPFITLVSIAFRLGPIGTVVDRNEGDDPIGSLNRLSAGSHWDSQSPPSRGGCRYRLNRLSAGSHWDKNDPSGGQTRTAVSIAFRLGPIGTPVFYMQDLVSMSQSPFGWVPLGLGACGRRSPERVSQSPFGWVPLGLGPFSKEKTQ